MEEQSDENFSYKEISDISDATEDIQAESLAGDTVDELGDYQTLLEATKKKMQIMDDESVAESVAQLGTSQKQEQSDEFLRNFFIKFGMKKTLESFQTEWYELRAKGELRDSLMPEIPPIYKRNQELSDELAVLQEELDEARIIAEKARSTYDKLRKQRDFQKINHRRVQQEKQKLNKDGDRNRAVYQKLEDEFALYENKYEVARQEKMLMRLEQDRLNARVDSLQATLQQQQEEMSTGLHAEDGS